MIKKLLHTLFFTPSDGNRITAVVPSPNLQPTAYVPPPCPVLPGDEQLARLFLGQVLGTLVTVRPLGRVGRVVLVFFEPHGEADPVLPVILARTGWLYKLAFRRLTGLLVSYNHLQPYQMHYPTWYGRSRFWTRVLVRQSPLVGAEQEFFVFHLLKTLNEPWRRS